MESKCLYVNVIKNCIIKKKSTYEEHNSGTYVTHIQSTPYITSTHDL